MRKNLSKGPNWHSTGQISYATTMDEFRHVDGRTGCCVLMKVVALCISFSLRQTTVRKEF
jgi:hypothetical protein